ncbi:hypothetical protein MUN53_14390 [Parabacteroides sp. AGMB00274]|uniref:Uncharacterized protein n=1 Tax=Parabacteroides faecalis TaxID=2924040 RepID=A0ABT0C436_9BACT|nr:hypothetical protein [Parabacteroides faecalis]MCJ2381778.1 hypothetical protein [Parabacteroides faecalis]
MEKKEITKTIYIANDGKEFLTKEDCEKHEKFVTEILSRIKYFCVRCHPDLTETGYFQHKIYVAVFSKHYLYKEIAFEWALRKFNGYLGESVQGYGFQPQFSVSEVSKEEYENCPPTEWGGSKLKSEKKFLSHKSVDGFPENIDYIKEWGFK